jgi:hypothetical protein
LLIHLQFHRLELNMKIGCAESEGKDTAAMQNWQDCGRRSPSRGISWLRPGPTNGLFDLLL